MFEEILLIMTEEQLETQLYCKTVLQPNCKHPKVTQQSTQTRVFDVLNGIEIIHDVCPTCHKILNVTVRML